MYEYKYKKADVTCTMFITYKNQVLVGFRGDQVDTFPGELCLPGGFMMVEQDNLRQTASKETMEEARIFIDESRWKIAGENSDWPGPDPRGHVVNILWHVELTESEYTNAQAGDDLKAIDWFNINELIENGVPTMAFNHKQLLEEWINERN